MPDPNPAPQEAEWDRVPNVICVVCPDCGFTFDANHYDYDADGFLGYSCPQCAEIALLDALAAEKAARELAERRNLLNPQATEYVTELETARDQALAERDALDAEMAEMVEAMDQRDEEFVALAEQRDQALAERDRAFYWLDQAHRQIKEFRVECDPRENKVLVTHFEMHAAALATTPAEHVEEPG